MSMLMKIELEDNRRKQPSPLPLLRQGQKDKKKNGWRKKPKRTSKRQKGCAVRHPWLQNLWPACSCQPLKHQPHPLSMLSPPEDGGTLLALMGDNFRAPSMSV